jgi:mannitol/fructose-specific phosphotransferase system IIA component (Ntr-type)
MKLCNYLKPEYIAVGLRADSKEDLLTKMVDLAGKNPHVLDKEKVRTAILDRERIMSTGVGKGFAIPHGKTDAVNEIVLAFATTSEPIDYAAMDNEPVRLVLMLISRDSDVGSRLKLLSRASKVMNSDSARKSLAEAKTADEILSIFQSEEERIGD